MDAMTRESAEADALVSLPGRLHDKFPMVPLSLIEQLVIEIGARYDGCRIREFVPLLVERESRDRLRALPLPSAWADAGFHAEVEHRMNGTAGTAVPEVHAG